MSDGGITFGWVISPTPPKRILDTVSDPTEAGRELDGGQRELHQGDAPAL